VLIRAAVVLIRAGVPMRPVQPLTSWRTSHRWRGPTPCSRETDAGPSGGTDAARPADAFHVKRSTASTGRAARPVSR